MTRERSRERVCIRAAALPCLKAGWKTTVRRSESKQK